ncbi:hypothetical protein [Desulfosporosinus burensis]
MAYCNFFIKPFFYQQYYHITYLLMVASSVFLLYYFLDSIRDAATSKEKESFIQSEEAPFVITQVRNDTVITIEVNHLFAFRLDLNTNDMFERNYALYGLNGISFNPT